MKKKLLLIISLFAIPSLFCTNYFVQLGTEGAASWDAEFVSANSGTLVDLNSEAKSFPAWYNATFTTTPEEVAKIYVIEGTYVFTIRITYQSNTQIYGGYNGTSLTRTVGTNFWDFADETIFDGNINTTQFIYGGGARTNVIFDGLTLQNGGGGAAVILRGSEIIRNCKLINNIASSSNGAAIYLYGGGNVYNCYFEGNKNNNATGSGGDIGTTNSGTRVIDGNMFVNSYALNKGAVLNITGASTVTFSNNIIRGATGSTAIVINSTTSSKPTVNIINNTFVNNTVQSIFISGVTDGYPNLKIYNCVFWSSSTLLGGLGKVGGAGDLNTIIKNCALMEIPPVSWTSANNFLLENTNAGDTPGVKYPGFEDPANNDFRITATSSLLDAGSVFEDLSNTKDFFGTTRPQGNKPDIGYHEFFVYTSVDQVRRPLEIICYTTNGRMMIENKEQMAAHTRVFNTTGSLIHEQVFNPGETLSLVLPKGIYLINVRNAEGTRNIKTLMP